MGGGWVNDMQVRREVLSRRATSSRDLKRVLEGLIDLALVYVGEMRPDGRPARGCLYPERVGCACRVIGVNEHAAGCPLVIEFASGFRGIAEPSWLTALEADD